MKVLTGNRKFWITVLSLALFTLIVMVRNVADYWGLAAAIGAIISPFMVGNVVTHFAEKKNAADDK